MVYLFQLLAVLALIRGLIYMALHRRAVSELSKITESYI